MTPEDQRLLARAVLATRVSYFTQDERRRLVEITRAVTGYGVEMTLLGDRRPDAATLVGNR